MKNERPIFSEDDFVDACRNLWTELGLDWGYYLNKKHFPIYERLLHKHYYSHFTEEVEAEARVLWQIANSPLAKALNEEDP